MSDEQANDPTGTIEVHEPLETGDDWTIRRIGLATLTEARQWVRANVKPGWRFRIVRVLQAGTVVSKSDVLVAD